MAIIQLVDLQEGLSYGKKVNDYIKKHWIYLTVFVIFSTFICRNFFESNYPAGTDTFGWISRVEYFKTTVWYLWDPSSFGVIRQSTMQNLLVLFNQILDNSIYTIKTLIFFIFILASFSMYNFTYTYLQNKLASFISGLLYIITPFFVGKITIGHLDQAFAYALLPFLFLTFDRALKNGRIKSILTFSVLIFIIANFTRLDILFYYGVFIIMFFMFALLLSPVKNVILKNTLRVGIYGSVFILLFSSFQLLPNIAGAVPPYISLSEKFAPIEHLSTWSLDFKRVIFGLTREVGYKGFLGGATWNNHPFLSKTQYFVLLSFLPIIAFSAILLSRSRLIFFFTISALLSIFLAKGPHEPFGELYIWFLNNIPFLNVIRAPTRWTAILSFAYAFLWGTFVNSVEEIFPEKKYLLSISVSILVVVLTFVTNPFVLTNGLHTWSPPEQETNPHKWIANQSGDFRVATVPYSQPHMNTGSLINISTGWWEHDIGTDSSFYHNKPVVGTGGWFWGRSPEFVKYTLGLIVENGTKNLMKILGTFDVKYLVIQGYLPSYPDILPKKVDPTYQHAFFKNQKGLKPVYSYGNATVYENEYWTPRIFATSRSAIIVGGREALTILAEIDEFNFTKWSLFFADQVMRENGKETFVNLLDRSDALIFVNSEPLDLAMLTLHNATRIKAAEYAYPSINAAEHWIPNDYAIRMGLFILNSETLSTSGENNAAIPVEIKEDRNYEVWARVIYRKNPGELSFKIDGREIGNIIPYSPSNSIKWVKVGDVDLSRGWHTLLLQNKKSHSGVANDVDEIVFVAPEELGAKRSEANRLIEKSNRIVFITEKQRIAEIPGGDLPPRLGFPELKYQTSEFKEYLVVYSHKESEKEIEFPDVFVVSEPSFEVNFTKINPTKYEVRIKADKPFFLIFSDSYHPLWKAYINGEEIGSVITYSFVNGFYINKTGMVDIEVEFIGQRYVWIGGVISVISLVFAIGYILFERKIK